jgi:hypothetical protein
MFRMSPDVAEIRLIVGSPGLSLTLRSREEAAIALENRLIFGLAFCISPKLARNTRRRDDARRPRSGTRSSAIVPMASPR